METLYDLLGARPYDDAERLKNAFRNAVKANHPDLHAGDPGASMRFRQIVGAYAILRRAEQRAAYDRLLEFQREQLRSKSNRIISNIISYVTRNIVSDAIAVISLTVVMAGGFTLFTHASKTFEAVKAVEVTIAATLSESRAWARDKLARAGVPNVLIVPSAVASEANGDDAQRIANSGPAQSSTGRDTQVSKMMDASGAVTNPADAKAIAEHLKKNYGIEALDQNKERLVGVQFSSLKRHNGVAKSPSPDVAISDKKHDLKISSKPRIVAKRQPTNHLSFKQAPLENKSMLACSGFQSCATTRRLFSVSDFRSEHVALR